MRSNSIPSDYWASKKSLSSEKLRLSSVQDSDEVVWEQFKNMNSGPNFYLCTQTQNSINRMIEDYSIIDWKEVNEIEENWMHRAISKLEIESPCEKLDEDEVTVIEFTQSNFDKEIEVCEVKN